MVMRRSQPRRCAYLHNSDTLAQGDSLLIRRVIRQEVRWQWNVPGGLVHPAAHSFDLLAVGANRH